MSSSARHERHDLEANRLTGNSPTLDAPVSGGILLVSSGSFDGAPSDTVLRGNHGASQHPGRPRFRRFGQNNRLTGKGCETSVPDGLCRDGKRPLLGRTTVVLAACRRPSTGHL